MPDGLFIDILPRFDMAAADALITKLTQGFRKAGTDIGATYGSEATVALRKLQDEIVRTQNVATAAADKEAQAQTAVDIAIQKRKDTLVTLGETEAKIARDIELQEDRVQAAKAKTAEVIKSIGELEDATAAQRATYNRARIAEISAENSLLDKQAASAATARNASATQIATTSSVAAANRDLTTATAAADAANVNAARSAATHDAAMAASGATASNVGRSFNTLGIVSAGAFALIGAESVKHAATWEASGAKMAAATHSTVDQIKALQDALLQLGPQIGTNSQDLMNASYLVSKAGFNDAASQVNILRVAAELGKVEGVGLEESVSGLTTTLNDFHIPADQAANVAAKFQTAFRDAKAPVDELMGSLHNFEPIMKLIADRGGDPSAFVGQTGAMLAQATQPGTSPDQASQNIRNTLLHLISANGPQADMLNQVLAPMGLTQQSLSTALNDPNLGPIGVMATMQQALHGATDPKTGLIHLDPQNVSLQAQQSLKTDYDQLQDPRSRDLADALLSGNATAEDKKSYNAQKWRDPLLGQWDTQFTRVAGLSAAAKNGQSLDQTPEQVMKAITGTDQGLLMMSSIAGDPQTLAKTLGISQQTTNAQSPNGKDIQDWQEVMDTFQTHVDQLKASLNALWIEIGTNVLPAFKGVVDVMKDVAEWMGNNKGIATTLVDTLGALAGAWVLVKTAMAIGSVVSGVVTGFTTIADIILAKTALSTDAIIAGNNLAATSYGEVSAAALEAGAAIEAQGPMAITAAGEVAGAAVTEVTAEETVTVAAGNATAAIGGMLIAAAALPAAVGAFLYFGKQLQDKNDPDGIKGTPTDLLARARSGGHGMSLDEAHTPNSAANPNATMSPSLGRHGPAAPAVDTSAPTSPGNIPGTAIPAAAANANNPAAMMQQLQQAIANIPKVDPSTLMNPAVGGGDSALDAGGGGGSSKPTATAPNIAAAAPYMPLDLNPADKPVNQTYDDWISKQKAVQSAMDKVNDTTISLSKAQADRAELLKKGTATQEQWNANAIALSKADREALQAKQELTIAQQKQAEGSKSGKSGSGDSWDKYDPFDQFKSGGFTLPNLVGFATTSFLNMALGNPYGQQQAKNRGGDPSNPMYVSDVGVGGPQGLLSRFLGQQNGQKGQNANGASPYGDGSGDIPVPSGGKGAEGWRDTVAATVAKYGPQVGISGANQQKWVDAIVSQIGTESGGNANAQNPNDSNGQGGRQSVSGLLQYLPSSYAGSGGKLTGLPFMDPVGQIAGAMFAPRNADGSPNTRAAGGIGAGHGWGPTNTPINPYATGDPAQKNVFPGSASGGGGGGDAGTTGSGLLGMLQSQFTGGGGEGPVFKKAPITPAIPGAPDYNGGNRFTPAIPGAADYTGAPGTPGAPAPIGGPPTATGLPSVLGGGGGVVGLAHSPIGKPGGIGNSATLGQGLGQPGRRVGPQDVPAPGLGTQPGSATDRDSSAGAAGGQSRQFGQDGGGGKGFGVGGGLLGSLESAASQAVSMGVNAVAPGAGGAASAATDMVTQLANRAIGYAGQVASIGVEGLMETFMLNDSPIADPSKSLFGKVALGMAGAHPSGGNSAGKTAPPAAPLKPDDKKAPEGSPASGNGKGAPPGPPAPLVNIENQHITNGDGGEAARDTARTFAGQR